MTDEEIIKKYEALLNRLGKRPRTVLQLILKNGSVSTYELGQLGYDQPPRAAQDLKEAGVSLKVSYGRHPKTGSRMAIYSLANIIAHIPHPQLSQSVFTYFYQKIKL